MRAKLPSSRSTSRRAAVGLLALAAVLGGAAAGQDSSSPDGAAGDRRVGPPVAPEDDEGGDEGARAEDGSDGPAAAPADEGGDADSGARDGDDGGPAGAATDGEDASAPEAGAGAERAPLGEPPAMRGMGLPLHSANPDYDYGEHLAELPDLGVTHVCLFVKLFQTEATSAAPGRRPLKTASDRTVLRTMRQAERLGLEVVLVPVVFLEDPGPDDWRGNLRPPDWDAWFAGYGRAVLHYARLAEQGRASVFAVGSELSSTERRVPQWRRLVRRVRGVFTGDLTYAANWDHYHGPTFWYLLDLIGLSGYYELAESSEPSLADLRTSWRRVRRRIERWRRRQGYEQPLLFLEVGYASQDGCAQHPWDYTRSARVDLEEQRLCYRAFAEAWGGADSLAGVFFYEWWGEGGAADTSYTPRGKPAADVLRRFYRER